MTTMREYYGLARRLAEDGRKVDKETKGMGYDQTLEFYRKRREQLRRDVPGMAEFMDAYNNSHWDPRNALSCLLFRVKHPNLKEYVFRREFSLLWNNVIRE